MGPMFFSHKNDLYNFIFRINGNNNYQIYKERLIAEKSEWILPRFRYLNIFLNLLLAQRC